MFPLLFCVDPWVSSVVVPGLVDTAVEADIDTWVDEDIVVAFGIDTDGDEDEADDEAHTRVRREEKVNAPEPPAASDS